MMNRAGSAAEASFVPSIMSFAGLEASSAQKQHTWDWETSSHNSNTFFPNAAPFFDCPPSLPPPPSPPPPPPPPVFFPASGFPFYLPPPAPDYPMGIIKSEESHVPGRIGLNLGHRTYFSSCDALAVDRLFAGARFGLLHPLGGQPPLCQAEGCKADLSRAKHYHRRHKVCEFHSKATVVVVSGLQQRFCQQCSRFHVLAEFDEAKRSCRKRLADHNRRRRKPQPLPTTAIDSPTYHSKNTTTTSAAATNPSETAKQAQKSTRYNTTGSKFTDTNSAIRKGPALSLGGVAAAAEKGSCAEINGMYRAGGVAINNVAVTAEEKDCTPSAFNNAYFRHQSLLCGSSSTTSEEASHVQSTPAPGHQHSHNLFHLGQALFEVDYM